MFTVLCKKACAETNCCRPLLTAGMAKSETVEFIFSPDWAALTKTAVFTDGTVTVDVLQSRWQGNTVTIPAEVITTAGRYVRVGVYGSNADGVALPTIWADLGKVRPGAEPSGDVSTDPSLPVWAQLQALIGDLDDLTTMAKDNLVAAINEAAQTGSGGSGSIDLRVADGYIQYSGDGGTTWKNLIALADLKGDDGAPGTPGAPGKDGTNGQDGYSPSASVSETDTGATITITDKTGTTTAEVKNGKDGKDGAPGKDGTNGKDGSPGAKGDPGATPNLQIGTVETLPAGSDATASVSGTAENPLLDLGIPKGEAGGSDLSLGITGAQVGQIAKITAVDASGKPTKWESYGWETIADIIVESEDVIYYRWDVNNKSEFVVLVSLTPLTDSASTVNGTVGLNTTGTPWGSTNFTITSNIQSVKAPDKGCSYMISGKMVDGKWIPGVFAKSFNTGNSWSSLTPGGGMTLPWDTTTNALSFKEIDEITSIAVGSYTKFFGVGSHIQILAR